MDARAASSKDHEMPSRSIGEGKSIQTLMARSPHLISRLAAEHEAYMNHMAVAEA